MSTGIKCHFSTSNGSNWATMEANPVTVVDLTQPAAVELSQERPKPPPTKQTLLKGFFKVVPATTKKCLVSAGEGVAKKSSITRGRPATMDVPELLAPPPRKLVVVKLSVQPSQRLALKLEVDKCDLCMF